MQDGGGDETTTAVDKVHKAVLANGSDPHTMTPVPQWRYMLGRRHRLGQLGAEHHIVAYSSTAAEGGGGRLLCGIRKGTNYSDLDL
jgi:hypothetical protein